MSAKMKEYRYYLSSGVNVSIRIKLSLLELAPPAALSAALSVSPPGAEGNGASSSSSSVTPIAAPTAAAAPPAAGRAPRSRRPSSSLEADPKGHHDDPNGVLRAFPAPALTQRSAGGSGGSLAELRNSSMNELFVTAQLFSDGVPLHAMVLSSTGPTKCSDSTIYWNEWLAFPVRYRDLARNAQLALTVWGVGGVPLGGTTLAMFTRRGVLRDGMQCLRIWPDRAADPSNPSATPSENDDEWSKQEGFRLDKLREQYERNQMTKNEWMDGVTDRRIARIRRGSEPPVGRKEAMGPFCSYREDALLWIELPYFGDTVVYEEEPYPQRHVAASGHGGHGHAQAEGSGTVTGTSSTSTTRRRGGHGSSSTTAAMAAGAGSAPTISMDPHLTQTTGAQYDSGNGRSDHAGHGALGGSSLIAVWDPDWSEENPVERKYRRLARDILRGSIDPNLKPSRDEKAAIEALLAMPTDTLRNQDKDLLWKFRYTLTDNKKAVVKFLLSVDWNEDTEVKQATDLLAKWCDIDIADALRLLGRDKEFKHSMVRKFAVDTLARATNDSLLDFLLQLVQALRYENVVRVPVSSTGRADDTGGSHDGATTGMGNTLTALGPLARFLIERSGADFQMANYFYWYLKVEASEIGRDAALFRTVLTQMLDEMKRGEPETRAIYDMLVLQEEFMEKLLTAHNKAREEKGRKDAKEEKFRHLLKQFPWPKLQKGQSVRLPLDPTRHLTSIVASSAKMFKSALYPAVVEFQTVLPPEHHVGDVQNRPTQSLSRGSNENDSLLETSSRGALGLSTLSLNSSMIGNGATAGAGGAASPSMNSSRVLVPGANGSDSALLRESLSTRVIHYLNRDKEGPAYRVMVKNGDDLRQDQLIMQMFILMDRLLKNVNLDLQLTPYRILATGVNDGLMEFVPDSVPVSYIVNPANFEYPQVQSFLRKHNPDPNESNGIAPEALNNYVKSVAGYCVLTYILGIGDRHLDNLMMKKSGQLFHIDFGFIFGADPKPYPPPFKLTKEMVEGMGGVDSEHYVRFLTYCCQAYNWLRKSADLILNLLSLMADGGIEELSNDPETTLQKVQEKFRLDLTDQQADQFFLSLINDSVTALFPVLIELIHRIATRMR